MTITAGDLSLPNFISGGSPSFSIPLLTGSESTAQAVNKLLQFMQSIAVGEMNNATAASNNAVLGVNAVGYNLVNPTLPSISQVGSTVSSGSNLPEYVVARIQAYMQTYPLGTDYAKDIVDGMSNAWFMKYFPAALPGGIDTLLQAVTQSLVPEILQEIIWSRARSQGLRDNARFEDEQVNTWASRGFSLPSGVLANQLMMKQQALAFTNSDLAAQQAIKALDIQVDGIKFAADISVKLQLGLIEGMKGMMDVYSRVAIAEMDHNAAMTNAANALYGAITGYYDTLIRTADTNNRAALGVAEVGVRQDATLQQAWSSLVRENVVAATSASQIYAQMTNAALGGLHGVTSASVT